MTAYTAATATCASYETDAATSDARLALAPKHHLADPALAARLLDVAPKLNDTPLQLGP